MWNTVLGGKVQRFRNGEKNASGKQTVLTCWMICCRVKVPLAVSRRFAMLRLLAIRLVGMTAGVVAAAAALAAATVAVWLDMDFPVPFLRAAVGMAVMLGATVTVGDVTAMDEQSLEGDPPDGPPGLWEGVTGAATVVVGEVGVGFAIGVTVMKLRCVAKRVAILIGS